MSLFVVSWTYDDVRGQVSSYCTTLSAAAELFERCKGDDTINAVCVMTTRAPDGFVTPDIIIESWRRDDD